MCLDAAVCVFDTLPEFFLFFAPGCAALASDASRVPPPPAPPPPFPGGGGKSAAEEAAAAAADATEASALLEALRGLSWVPVTPRPPAPYMPWARAGGEDGSGVAGAVARPRDVRLPGDAWAAGATFRMLALPPDAPPPPRELVAAMAWDAPLDAVVVASQLAALGRLFESDWPGATPRAAAAAAATAAVTMGKCIPVSAGARGGAPSPSGALAAPPGATAAAHSVTHSPIAAAAAIDVGATPGEASARAAAAQVVSCEVPKLYHLLSALTSGGGGGGAGGAVAAAALAGAPWVWVGTAFVHAERAAFTCPPHAAPYLHAVPGDLASFGPLLRRFGVRSAFGPSDFIGVLGRLGAECVRACVCPPPPPHACDVAQTRVTGTPRRRCHRTAWSSRCRWCRCVRVFRYAFRHMRLRVCARCCCAFACVVLCMLGNAARTSISQIQSNEMH